MSVPSAGEPAGSRLLALAVFGFVIGQMLWNGHDQGLTQALEGIMDEDAAGLVGHMVVTPARAR